MNISDTSLWTPSAVFENLQPQFDRTSDHIAIRSERSTDCGKWSTVVNITPDAHYRFSAVLSIHEITWLNISVRIIIKLYSAEGKWIRCEYVTDFRKIADDRYEVSKEFDTHEARQVHIELMLWNTDHGEAEMSQMQLDETESKPHRKVRVATTYISPYTADSKTVPDRLEKIKRTLEAAASLKPDIVLLSECIADRELGLPIDQTSESVPGLLTSIAAEYARKARMYVIINLHENSEEGFFHNTSVLIDRSGQITGRYRKVHLTLNECERGLTPGRDYPIFDTDFGRIGMVTCFDQFFPETVRQVSVKGAELVFIPTAGDGYLQTTCRALDNAVPICVAGVNHNKKSTVPQSRIIDADGNTLAATSEDETAVSAVIDLDAPLQSFWFSMPAWTNKRDVYVCERREDTFLL